MFDPARPRPFSSFRVHSVLRLRAGVVRVVIGDNWESGGKNRSTNGETPFLLVDATVEADGQVIIKTAS
jgi:hypothetical protein